MNIRLKIFISIIKVMFHYCAIQCSAIPLIMLANKTAPKKANHHHHHNALNSFNISALNTPRAQPRTFKTKSEILTEQFDQAVAQFNTLLADKKTQKPFLQREFGKIENLYRQFSSDYLKISPRIKINYNAIKSKFRKSDLPSKTPRKTLTVQLKTAKKPPAKMKPARLKEQIELSENDLALEHLKRVFLRCMQSNFIKNADYLKKKKPLFKPKTILDLNVASMHKTIENMKFFDAHVAKTYFHVLEFHKREIERALTEAHILKTLSLLAMHKKSHTQNKRK